MRAEFLHVAVRPRGILECLDLAVMVCGRRPLAVAVATAVGALPCILLNRAVLPRPDPDGLTLALVVLGVEAAWVSVPLTLFLGQAVFSNRFSWRLAVRSFVGGLPALLVFQGLLRLVCLASWVLGPPWLVGTYYLGQIVALERPPAAKVWQRRGAINRGRVGRLVGLWMLDCLVLATGTAIGMGFLGSLASLWRGGSGWASVIDAGLVPALFTWHGQIALWATCGFLAIFRFFTYLDARIRSEGWDVELKLRADATYAGLARTDGATRRVAAAAVLAVVALVTLAAPAGAAEPPDLAAPDGVARRALARQEFPWYDAAADRYRPLIDPEQRAADSAREGSGGAGGRGAGSGDGWGRGLGRGAGGGGRPATVPPAPRLTPPPALPAEIGQALLIAILVIGGAVLAYLVVRYWPGSRTRDGGGDPGDEPAPDDADKPLPAGIRVADGDLLARCAAEADRGDFATAMLFFHAWLLVELDRRGSLVLARGKTNGQYAAEVTDSGPMLSSMFRASSRLFEDAFFGRLAVGRSDFLAVWDRRDLVAAAAERVR